MNPTGELSVVDEESINKIEAGKHHFEFVAQDQNIFHDTYGPTRSELYSLI
jgi:hypothetical protein